MRKIYFLGVVMSLLIGFSVSADAYYIVGDMTGYNAPKDMSEIEREKYALTDEDGDSVYSLTIDIPQNKFNFVLFKGLTDWNSQDIYRAEETFELIDKAEIQLTKNISQNISCSNWIGGEVQLDFDAKTERLKIYNKSIESEDILYLVGAPTGYVEPTIKNEDSFENAKFIDADGDGIFKGSFSIPIDGFEFCFAKGLNGDSTDYIVPDNAEVVKFDFDGKYFGTTDIANTPRYWINNELEIACRVTFIYDSTANTISFSSDTLNKSKYLYLIGTPSGWSAPTLDSEETLKKWRLVNSEENEYLYKGDFEIDNSQQLIFMFYGKLTGWDGGSYGCEVIDAPYEYEVDENGIYRGTIVKGKGKWTFSQWPSSKLYVEVDLLNMLVKFSSNAASVNKPCEDETKIFLDSTKKLYIQAPRDKIEYEIYDIRGQLMISGKEKVANIRHLLPSIYFIKVFDEKNYYISKFIVR